MMSEDTLRKAAPRDPWLGSFLDPEPIKPNRQSFGIWTLFELGGPQDPASVERLDPLSQHRPVSLVAEPTGDVHHAIGRDAHQVAVVREMVNGTKREAVAHLLEPVLSKLDDVGGLDEFRWLRAQTAHRFR